jgi:hypothetical protein
MAQENSPPSGSFWWEEGAFGAGDSSMVAFEECAAWRRSFIDENLAWAKNAQSDAGDPDIDQSIARALAAVKEIGGLQGDLAHWVWAFEMQEPERELFRGLNPADRWIRLCGLDTGGVAYLGISFFAPGDAGAELRTMARARSFALDLATGRPGSNPPFKLDEVGAKAGLGASRHAAWAHWKAASAIRGHLGAPLAVTAATGGLALAGVVAPALALSAMGAFCVSFAVQRLGASPKAPWRQLMDSRLRRAYPELDQREFFASLGSAAFFHGGYWHEHLTSMKEPIESATERVGDSPDALDLGRALENMPSNAPWPSGALRSRWEKECLATETKPEALKQAQLSSKPRL